MKTKTTIENVFQEFIDEEGYIIGRCGNVEISSLLGDDKQIRTNAGFYGSEEDLKKFKKLYLEAIKNFDVNQIVLSCNSFRMVDNFFVANNIYKPSIPYMEYCELYLKLIETLTQKYKVGFISFFKEDIKEQGKNINKIWNGNFNIKTDNLVFVKSYNTTDKFDKPHNNYFETLEDLTSRVLDKKNVKYWFISCGAYGLPLCNNLKKEGKNCFYVGGILQCFFGILGSRWMDRREITNNCNFYWKTVQHVPLQELSNLKSIENGCYI